MEAHLTLTVSVWSDWSGPSLKGSADPLAASRIALLPIIISQPRARESITLTRSRSLRKPICPIPFYNFWLVDSCNTDTYWICTSVDEYWPPVARDCNIIEGSIGIECHRPRVTYLTSNWVSILWQCSVAPQRLLVPSENSNDNTSLSTSQSFDKNVMICSSRIQPTIPRALERAAVEDSITNRTLNA